jgi:predicted LPLAT superfamily acyltransferase
MLADRTLDEAGGVRCDFLGRPALFPTGPIRVGMVLKRPMLLVFGLYHGANRYDIHIERFADPDEALTRARDAAADDLLRRYVARLEHYCRLAPYNWFNFHDFWR